MKRKILITIIGILVAGIILINSSCTQKTCPTYAKGGAKAYIAKHSR